MTLFVGCGSYANANLGQVSFEAGYRRDNIEWKQRLPSDDPHFSSSQKFKDLDIFQIGLRGRTTVGCNFYVRGNAYWGWILDGDYERHTERVFDGGSYFSDNFRGGLSDRFRSTIDDKYVFGIGGAVGYPFYFCDCTMVVAPVIGYAFDEQNVRLDDEGVDFGSYGSGFGFDNGEHCCRHTFISRWYGPFVGVDFDWRPWNSCFDLWAELEYHWGHFRGKRSNFDEFGNNHNRSSHNADAWKIALGIDYDFNSCWTAGLSFEYQDWSASRHHRWDNNFSDNSSSDRPRVRQNNDWRSYAINVTFGRDF